MPHSLGPRSVVRLVLLLGALLLSTACGSSTGCQGCEPTPIPGGFPQAERVDNAMQVRLTNTGMTFLEDNFENLLEVLVPGGTTFTIPPVCNSSPQICCDGSTCEAEIDVTGVELTPVPQSSVDLLLEARVSTNSLKVEVDVPVLGWQSCNLTYDSAKDGVSTVGISARMDLVVQANDNNKLKLARSSGDLVDFETGDLTLSGAWYCDFVDWFVPLFEGTIKTQLMGVVDDVVDGMLEELPMGQEGRFDAASVLAAFSPRTQATIDYFLWAGGYAEAEQNGMSVGGMSGVVAAEHNVCVPDCEAPGSSCAKPAKPAIPRSTAFRGNKRPDGLSFDVGFGIHQTTLDQAAYGFWRSGGLCLDISSQSVSQLSTDLFSLLLPSLKELTNGQPSAMMVAVRPRQPPKAVLGYGTYHFGDENEVVIDEPLINFQAQDLAIDVYVQLDERMVRLLTLVGDLDAPVLLFADGEGRLQPILGALDQAYTNLRIEDAHLLGEDEETLAKLFPTIINLATGFLATGFEPIELPSVQGLELVLEEGSITSVDEKSFLAVFAKLAMSQTTGFGAGLDRVETRAQVQALRVPPTELFQLGAPDRAEQAPAVDLLLSGELLSGKSHGPLEFTYRVDGGFFHPWAPATQITVQDPLFWLQGWHEIEVVARVKGQHRTMDLSPQRIPVLIDTVAPQVTLERTAQGVTAVVHDSVSPVNALQLSWSINGQPFATFGAQQQQTVPQDVPVAVKVRDEAGNLAEAALSADSNVAPSLAAEDQGGCAVVSGTGQAQSALGWVLVLGLLVGVARRRRAAQPGDKSRTRC